MGGAISKQSTDSSPVQSLKSSRTLIKCQAQLDHAKIELPLGSRHQLSSGLCGVIRYVGPPPGSLDDDFHHGHIFVFLELDTPSGNSDGHVGGVQLVEGISPKHGICVERELVVAPAPELHLLHQKTKEGSHYGENHQCIVAVQSKIRKRQASTKVHNIRQSKARSTDFDFHEVDSHACRCPQSVRSSLQTLVDYLISPAFIDTDVKKARVLFRWCADNIEYDVESYHSGKFASQDPSDVLRTGKGVCAGYSKIVQSLMDLANIECVSLSGASKAASYKMSMTADQLKSNHAWNAIKLDGKWEFLET